MDGKREIKGAWGPCNGGHLFSKLKIRTQSEKIFLLLMMRVAVWERRFGCWPAGWDFEDIPVACGAREAVPGRVLPWQPQAGLRAKSLVQGHMAGKLCWAWTRDSAGQRGSQGLGDWKGERDMAYSPRSGPMGRVG